MKKTIYFFIVLIASLFLINDVKAATTSGAECVDKGTCLILCNYKNTYNESRVDENNVSGYRYITIYYNFSSSQFMVGWWNGTQDQYGVNRKLKGPDSYSNIFGNKGYNIYNQNTVTQMDGGNSFVCPTHAYFDESGLNGGNEVCFDNNGNWCRDNKSNVGTTFGKGNYVSDEKNIDFEDEIENYFNNSSVGEITVDDFINGTYKTADDIIDKIVLKDFKANYLNGYDMPEFIANSTAYKNGYKNVKNALDNKIKEWEKELEKKVEDGTITNEKKNEILDNLTDISENIEDVAQDKLENINKIEASGSDVKLPVEDVDICTNNNTLKIFQVIGKIIIIIKILVPIILIVMGSIDFAKASLSGDDKAISQAAVTLGKRILIGLIIFFIPTVLDFFLSLVSGVSDTMGKYEACTNCVLNPNNESKCSTNPINS